MSSFATHIIDLTGGTVHTVDSLLAAAVPSGASLVSSLNAQLGSTVWQTHPSGSDIVAAVNAALGGTTWQSGGSGTPTFGSLTGAVADNAALVAAFAGKANTSHTHTLSQITDVTVTSDMVAITKGFRPGLYDDLASPPVGTIIESSNDGHLYWIHRDGSKHLLCDSGGYSGASVEWGDIGGTLSFQADLQAELDGKQNASDVLTGITTVAAAATTYELFCVDASEFVFGVELSSYMMGVLQSANATLARANLELTPGTHVQAYNGNLQAIAGLTSATDKGVYFTGANTAATYTITTAGRALVGNTSAAGMRSTLGLVIGTNVQAYAGMLQSIAGVPQPFDAFLYYDGSGVCDSTPITTAGRDLMAAATPLAQRTVMRTGDGIRAWPGNYYNAMDLSIFTSNITMTLDRLHLIPFRFDADETWDEIYTSVGITGAGSVRLGIYTSDHAPSPTFTRIVDAGVVSVSTAGLKAITGLATAIPANKIVFLGLLPQVTYSSNGGNVTSVLSQKLIRGSTAHNGGFVIGFFKAATYSSGLPATVSGVSLLGSMAVPIVGLRTV